MRKAELSKGQIGSRDTITWDKHASCAAICWNGYVWKDRWCRCKYIGWLRYCRDSLRAKQVNNFRWDVEIDYGGRRRMSVFRLKTTFKEWAELSKLVGW